MNENKLGVGVESGASKGTEGGAENGAEKGSEQGNGGANSKTFTQEELNSILESRLSREKEAFNKKLQDEADKLAEEKVKEKHRISQLSDEELTNEELAMKRKELDDINKAIAEGEAKQAFDARLTASEGSLRDKKVDARFAKLLIKGDDDSTFENLKEFVSLFEEVLEPYKEQAKKGVTPRSNATNKVAITKAEFDALDYRGKMKVYNENNDLYKKYTKKTR